MNDVVPDFTPAAPDPGLQARFPNSPQLFGEVQRPPSADLGRALFPNSPALHGPEPEPAAPAPAPAPAPAVVEPQQPPAAVLPEAYADLAAPEGYQINPEAFAPVAAELGKLGVSREQAEGLLKVHADLERQQDAALAAENQRWRQDAERALQPGDRQAIAVAMSTAPAEVKRLLGRTGLGNHPALVRWIAALGRRLR